MNSENSKTSKHHVLILKLTNKIHLRRGEKWNDEFELPDGSYSVLNIQYYFEYIFKKHNEKTGNHI